MTAKIGQRTATVRSVKKSKLTPDRSGDSNTDFFCTALTCSSNDRFSRSEEVLPMYVSNKMYGLLKHLTSQVCSLLC
jgi:hypothetical protein